MRMTRQSGQYTYSMGDTWSTIFRYDESGNESTKKLLMPLDENGDEWVIWDDLLIGLKPWKQPSSKCPIYVSGVLRDDRKIILRYEDWESPAPVVLVEENEST